MTATDEFGGPSHVVVTLRRSVIGESPKARGTIRALGLRRIDSRAEHKVTPVLLGMLRRVRHLVTVEPLALANADGEHNSGSSSRRRELTSVERSKNGTLVSFTSGMTVRQADAALHEVASEMGDFDEIALFWDEGDASVRKYEPTRDGAERPWLTRDPARLILLRLEGPDWLLAIEPKLSRPPKNVPIYVGVAGADLEKIVQVVQRLGSDDTADELRESLKAGSTEKDA